MMATRAPDKTGRITIPLKPDPTNKHWLEKEKVRIEKASGDSCEIIVNPFDGYIALFYKHVYYHEGIRYEK